MLETIASVVILIGAVCVAVTNIWKFFANGGKGIKKHVEQVRDEQKCAEEIHIRDVVAAIQEEESEHVQEVILNIMKDALPDALTEHYKQIRDQFKGDRERYLHDITDEVTHNLQTSLEAVEAHETRMMVFTEVLKELLRERIMAIYSRNRHKRELEEHEKVELERSYASYKSIKGNSYIDDYYKRMQTWKVIPDNYT
jgi:hypothetical protein